MTSFEFTSSMMTETEHKRVNSQIDRAMEIFDDKFNGKFGNFGDEIFKTQIQETHDPKEKLSKKIMGDIMGKPLHEGLEAICVIIEKQNEVLEQLQQDMAVLTKKDKEKIYI